MNKTTEEMRAELEAAGYELLPEHFDGMTFSDYTGWIKCPDGKWIEGEEFPYKKQSEAQEALRKANESTIQKAYEHLQKERQFEAMKAFIEKVAAYDVQDNFNGRMSDEQTIADAHMRNLEDFVNEAQKLLVE